MKKHMSHKWLTTALVSTLFLSAVARENGPGEDAHKVSNVQKVAAKCAPPQSSAVLSVNNVRTIIYSGGDMWWDLFGSGNAYYVIPNIEDKTKWKSSNFSGSLWLGGLDANQLKLSAMTYRQTGIDFWPGPLGTVNDPTDIEPSTCTKYDKIFRMTRNEVEEFVANGTITQTMRDWPGNGDPTVNQELLLAPFIDANGDNYYNPDDGDYPAYDLTGGAGVDNLGVCKAKLYGDETLWWVFNDKGNIHTETGATAMGFEIRAQAFGFKTNDEINDMTFYNYEIINRSSFTLGQTYFTVWTDADLGYYSDDYVGCDVARGLGYIYNADGYDESVAGTNGYGDYPPALGCDFFQGPLADPGDGLDNDRDGQIDELGEQIIMSQFLYYNNNIGSFPPQTTNPSVASHFYGYMTGFWKDGSPFTCDAPNGYGGVTPTKFLFPNDTYPGSPCGATPWTEAASGNLPGDRRFLQSAGPFTLQPGALNRVTFGLPWVQTTLKNNPLSSVDLLRQADSKAQALFDNCFKILDGPEAPEITIQENDRELILYLTNNPSSNNYNGKYAEKDTLISCPSCVGTIDKTYRFEGYKVYQLRDPSTSQTDLSDESKAKLVFQCDIKNGVSKLVNFQYNNDAEADMPVVKVLGDDKGIFNSIRITQDQFATGTDNRIVNHKTYYYIAVAYAYNNYHTYKEDTDPASNPNTANSDGQKTPYLEGRKVKRASGIPHYASPEKDGTITNGYYGYGPKLTRIEGQGNGANILDITDESINQLLAQTAGMNPSQARLVNPVYENARGPIAIKIVDPLNVPKGNFIFKMLKDTLPLDSGKINPKNRWSLQCTSLPASGTNPYNSLKTLEIGEEELILPWGLSVSVRQVKECAVSTDTNKTFHFDTDAFLESSISFSDPTKPWLTGVQDNDLQTSQNWIRAGTSSDPNAAWFNDYRKSDPDQATEKIVNGTWAPYMMCAESYSTATGMVVEAGPAKAVGPANQGSYEPRTMASIDVVFTSDKSKWTRCPVVEMCDDPTMSYSNTPKMALRRQASVDKNGAPTPGPDNNDYATGMGWFPGYAVNMETGERLNMMFGEDTGPYSGVTGRDMIWNPTTEIYNSAGYAVFGKRHYVYVFSPTRQVPYATGGSIPAALQGRMKGSDRYDGGKNVYLHLQAGMGSFVPAMKELMMDAQYVTLPVISDARYVFDDPANMPCDAKVRIRVRKPYRFGYSAYLGNPIVGSAGCITSTLQYPATPIPNANIYCLYTTDTAAAPVNNNYPMYTFNTDDIYTETNVSNTAKNALDLIKVVPNPYYAYSSYEINKLDNRVRITNLPNKCTIRIYTLNGTMIRTYKRDVSGQEDEEVKSSNDVVSPKRKPYQDWDLKNQNGIPIASGLYIIYVDAPGVGEKILKWFGVMRPIDLTNY